MKRQPWRCLAWAASLSLTCVAAGWPAPVTLSIKDQSGASAADTIIVFDPLDAAVPPGHGAAIIDQLDKTFVPRVSVIRTGTAVTFPNSDRIRHQVYSFSQPHPFNLKLYAGSPRADIVFDKPGLVVLGCNIHDSMVAFIGVVDSPYFLKTPPSGASVLEVPAGRYRLRVWHPNMTTSVASQIIQVGSAPLEIKLRVDIDPQHATEVAWPD